MSTGILIFLIFLSIFLNILFVISEFILIRVIKPNELKLGEHTKRSKYLDKINEDPNVHILTAQIGITASHILFGALSFNAFNEINTVYLEKISFNTEFLSIVSMSLSFFIVVFFYSLIAEYIPKMATSGHIDGLSRVIAPFIYSFRYIFIVFILPIRMISNIFFTIIKQKPSKNIYNPIYTENELKVILQRSQKEGVIEASEHQLINRIFEFTDMSVKSILTPRPDVIAVSVNDDMDEFINRAKKSKFSKFPIYEGTLENIIGILHLKELAYRKYTNDEFDIMKVKRGFLSIHENMKLDLLLKKMKKKLTHIAVVYDEFGIFAGIVTLEDVLEALVGNLTEETDDIIESIEIQKITNSVYKINANMSLNRFNKLFNTEFRSENSKAISGYILEHFDGLPKEDDDWKFDDMIFYNFNINGKRITQFNVKIHKKHQTKKLAELLN